MVSSSGIAESRATAFRWPYIALAVAAILIFCCGYFTPFGIAGITLLTALLCAAVAICLLGYRKMKIAGHEVEANKFCAASFIILFLVGEFGASTESRMSFLISFWRLGILLFFLVAVKKDSNDGFRAWLKIRSSQVILALAILLVTVCLVSVLHAVLDIGWSSKGAVRSILFYSSLALALYCAMVFLQSDETVSTIRTVFRVALALWIGFALFEMVVGFHLPSSWMNSSDETAVMKIAQVGDMSRWVSATGPYYNPNNFCLLLGILSCLSLPCWSEKKAGRRLALVLFYLTLLVVSSLGSTIVSIGMLVAFILWRLATKGRSSVSALAQIALALFLVFLAPGGFLALLRELSEITRGLGPMTVDSFSVTNAADVTRDLGVQASNYKNGTGSMWARLTLYRDLLAAIAQNPFGVGGGGIHGYLTAVPSASGLIDPHSWFLEFALCYGWIPFVLYVATNVILVYGLLHRWDKGREDYPSRLCATLCVSYIASFSPSSSDFNTILWLPVILGFAFLASARGSSRQKPCPVNGGDGADRTLQIVRC